MFSWVMTRLGDLAFSMKVNDVQSPNRVLELIVVRHFQVHVEEQAELLLLTRLTGDSTPEDSKGP